MVEKQQRQLKATKGSADGKVVDLTILGRRYKGKVMRRPWTKQPRKGTWRLGTTQ